ncbi:hypothetical protein [Apilactobacillus timberlakei]|uniref:hypothetical protein n=1 Tax=Apilactobacillus timberlakei TaxID=2008380 RepID=UPI001127B8FF|nr:hypothetical protein [Apilactobacillus timberlakei]TPR21560.1 hypothetical protein DY083_05940 [Apilactobacillus timberlakei]
MTDKIWDVLNEKNFKKYINYLFLIKIISMVIIYYQYYKYPYNVNNHLHYFTSGLKDIGNLCINIINMLIQNNIIDSFLVFFIITLFAVLLIDDMYIDFQKNFFTAIIKLIEVASFMLLEIGIFIYFLAFPIMMIIAVLNCNLPNNNIKNIEILLSLNVVFSVLEFALNTSINKLFHQILPLIR